MNFDFPVNHVTKHLDEDKWFHRMARCGRSGKPGLAIQLFDSSIAKENAHMEQLLSHKDSEGEDCLRIWDLETRTVKDLNLLFESHIQSCSDAFGGGLAVPPVQEEEIEEKVVKAIGCNESCTLDHSGKECLVCSLLWEEHDCTDRHLCTDSRRASYQVNAIDEVEEKVDI